MHAAFPANTLAIFGKPEVKEPPQPDPPVIGQGYMLSLLTTPVGGPTHLSPQELESMYRRYLDPDLLREMREQNALMDAALEGARKDREQRERERQIEIMRNLSPFARVLYRITKGARFGDMDEFMAQVLATVCAADFR